MSDRPVVIRKMESGEDEWGRKFVSTTVSMPSSPEECLRFLSHALPEIDWRGLTMYKFQAPDGTMVLALPAPVMEQLLSQVVGLCMVLTHDGPAH